jgi:hypothetical protein
VVVLVAVALVVLRPLAALQLLGKVMRVVVRLAVDQIITAAATMVQLIHQLDQPEVLVVAVKAVHPAMKPEKMEQATPAVAAAAVLTLMV